MISSSRGHGRFQETTTGHNPKLDSDKSRWSNPDGHLLSAHNGRFPWKMTTPLSPQLIPMTPAFGPMKGSALPFAQPASRPSEPTYATNYPGPQQQNYAFNSVPTQNLLSNSISAPIPNAFPAYPQIVSNTQQFAAVPNYPSLPTTIYQSVQGVPQQYAYQTVNQGINPPQFISTIGKPKPFPAPYTSVLDQNVEYVSPEAFAHLFQGPKNIPVTRIAHTQVRPLPNSQFQTSSDNFIPVAVAPKYSTQMSARVKFQGPAFKGDQVPKPATVNGFQSQSITVSVQPMPKPNQLPVAAQSYAMVKNDAQRPTYSVKHSPLIPPS